jgi:flagellar motor switch protein FliG
MPGERGPDGPADPGVRAAAVLLALGRDAGTAVLKLLSEPDLRKLAQAAKNLGQNQGVLRPALQDFLAAMDNPTHGQVAPGTLRSWAVGSLDPELISSAFDELPARAPVDEILGPISAADPETLAMVLAREHAQTIALVLSTMPSQRSSEVMQRLPPALHAEVIQRMAKVEAISPELLREVGLVLASEVRAAASGGMRKVEGRANALEILRNKPSAEQGELVKQIEQSDGELAADLRSKLFTFEDIIHLPDRDIQALLKEFDTKVLMVALKGASPEVSAKVLKNMSSRAADMVRDDLAAMGPVRLADVDQAQAQLVVVVTKLATEGRIRIIGPADKMV